MVDIANFRNLPNLRANWVNSISDVFRHLLICELELQKHSRKDILWQWKQYSESQFRPMWIWVTHSSPEPRKWHFMKSIMCWWIIPKIPKLVLYFRDRQPFLHCGPVWNWNFFADRPSKITNVQQWTFITTHVSYYYFDLMRTLSLFCRNETLPSRNYGTQWHQQCAPHVQSVSRFRLCFGYHRKSRLAQEGCRKWQQSF